MVIYVMKCSNFSRKFLFDFIAYMLVTYVNNINHGNFINSTHKILLINYILSENIRGLTLNILAHYPSNFPVVANNS